MDEESVKMIDFNSLSKQLKNERVPALILNLDALDRALEQVRRYLAPQPNIRCRLSTHSLKSPKILEKILKKGPPFEGLLTHSAEETAYLSLHGFNDFLVRYPSIQKSDLKLIREIHPKVQALTLVADGIEILDGLNEAGKGSTTPLRVMLELDFNDQSIQSSITSTQQAFKLLNILATESHLKLDGFLITEKIKHTESENQWFKTLFPTLVANRAERRKRTFRERCIQFKESCIERAIEAKNWNSDFFDPQRFNEISPNFFNETMIGHSRLRQIAEEPIFMVALQLNHKISEDVFRCQGGADLDPHFECLFPKNSLSVQGDFGLMPDLLIQLLDQSKLEVGDYAYLGVSDASRVMERFREFYIVSRNEIVGREKTYRGLGVTFH